MRILPSIFRPVLAVVAALPLAAASLDATAQDPGIQIAPAISADIIKQAVDADGEAGPETAGPLDIPVLPSLGKLLAPDIPWGALVPPDNADLAYGAFQRDNYDLAFRRALPRAASGDAVAQTLLGRIYEGGLGIETDITKAVDWYRIAAESGDSEAQYLLGLMHLDGRGVEKNLEAAADWFERAAEAGQAESIYNTGLLYLQGKVRPPDPGKAIDYFRRAAERGVSDAQYALGVSYLEGAGVVPSDIEAAKWLRTAAQNNHLDAQVEFGILRFQGRGVEANESEAAAWFFRAAERGSPIAMNRLARLMASGRGIGLDPIEAAKWHILARAIGLSDLMLDGFVDTLADEDRAEAEKRALNWVIENRAAALAPIAPEF